MVYYNELTEYLAKILYNNFNVIQDLRPLLEMKSNFKSVVGVFIDKK